MFTLHYSHFHTLCENTISVNSSGMWWFVWSMCGSGKCLSSSSYLNLLPLSISKFFVPRKTQHLRLMRCYKYTWWNLKCFYNVAPIKGVGSFLEQYDLLSHLPFWSIPSHWNISLLFLSQATNNLLGVQLACVWKVCAKKCRLQPVDLAELVFDNGAQHFHMEVE